MRIRNFRWLLPVAGLTALAIAGCGGGSHERASAPTTSPATSGTTLETDTATEPRTDCDRTVAALAEDAGDVSGGVDPVFLDGLGLAAPQHCRDIAELRAALAAHELDGLDEFVISSCVAGDAWALLGEPSVTTDTALCREARSTFTLVAGRRLVPAEATYAESFSSGCADWSTDRDGRVALSCRDGAYHVLVRKPDRPQQSRILTDRPQSQLSVETDATLVRPRRGKFELHGVSCWTSPTHGYVFALDPTGFFVIAREDHGAAGSRLLKKGKTMRALTGVGVRNRIRGECQAGPDGVTLALYVNGDRVAVARDGGGPKSFSAFGLYVATSEPGTEVRFDGVLVRGEGDA